MLPAPVLQRILSLIRMKHILACLADGLGASGRLKQKTAGHAAATCCRRPQVGATAGMCSRDENWMQGRVLGQEETMGKRGFYEVVFYVECGHKQRLQPVPQGGWAGREWGGLMEKGRAGRTGDRQGGGSAGDKHGWPRVVMQPAGLGSTAPRSRLRSTCARRWRRGARSRAPPAPGAPTGGRPPPWPPCDP